MYYIQLEEVSERQKDFKKRVKITEYQNWKKLKANEKEKRKKGLRGGK